MFLDKDKTLTQQFLRLLCCYLYEVSENCSHKKRFGGLRPLTVSFNVEKYLSKSIVVLITKDYSIFIFISQMKAYFRDLFRMTTSLVTVTCITHPKHTHKKPNQTKKHTQTKP